MIAYLYLIKFKDGTETVAVGQEDHGSTSNIDDILCSQPIYIDDGDTIDEVIKNLKHEILNYEEPEIDQDPPTKRIIN